MQNAPPLLQLREITKSFQAVRALRGVSFDLHRGEVHALLGENGAGKSTLIKVITGAHQPDSGSIEIEGKSGGTARSRRFKGDGNCRHLPAAGSLSRPDVWQKTLRSAWRPHQLRAAYAGADRQNQARQFLNRVGAEIDPDTEVRNLSMPEQQLVEIARSLGAGARILIMDEPTASLTQNEVHLLYSVVRDLRTQGVGVIYISHRMEEIFALADRVTVLRDGESIATQDTKGMNESTLIKLMVGREVSTPLSSLGNLARRCRAFIARNRLQRIGRSRCQSRSARRRSRRLCGNRRRRPDGVGPRSFRNNPRGHRNDLAWAERACRFGPLVKR